VESGGDVISLANGCVCCNIRDDLLAAVTQVIERPEEPEYIVLEASGVAEPSGIAVTFMDQGLRDRIRLDSIMCIVDASQIFAAPELMELKLRQIAFADMLILNKADLVSRDEIARIKTWLDEHFHRYRLVESVRGEVPLEILLSAGRFDATPLETETYKHDGHECHDPHCGHHGGEQKISTEDNKVNKGVVVAGSPFTSLPSVPIQNHSRAFSTWSYETNEPLSLEALREVARKPPANIYRCACH
jgi:G3E family GTPase